MTQDVKRGVVRNTLRAPARYAAAVLLAILSLSLVAVADHASADEAPCPNGNAGLTLPKGFCATVFADDLGRAAPPRRGA